MRAAVAGGNPGAQPRRGDDEPHVIPAREVPRRERGDLVDAEVERRAPRLARPELDARVEQEPHDVALLALHLADDELAPPRARLPRDAPERVARDVVAQLPELVAFARERRGVAPPPPCAASDRPCGETIIACSARGSTSMP